MKRNTISITIIAALFLLTACKVEVDWPGVNDSIYGTYFKDDPPPGDWTGLFDGTRIFVEPVNASLIKITIPRLEAVFDSVQLVTEKSFVIDEMEEKASAPSGYFKVTGHGSFGSKNISLIFTRREDTTTGSPGWSYSFSNFRKTRN